MYRLLVHLKEGIAMTIVEAVVSNTCEAGVSELPPA